MPPRRSKGTLSEAPAQLMIDMDTLRDLADEWPDDYVSCRARMHAWEGRTAALEGSVIDVEEMCLRCKSTRAFHISAVTGEQLTRPAISYASGYLAPKGSGRMGADGRGLMRIMSTQRSYPTLSIPGIKRPAKRKAKI